MGTLAAEVEAYICKQAERPLPNSLWPVQSALVDAGEIFRIDWKDDIRSTLDADYPYPSLQAFLETREMPPLSDDERAAIVGLTVPDWRAAYHRINGNLEGEGYAELRAAIPQRSADMMIYENGNDGWGFPIAAPGAADRWHGRKTEGFAILTLEQFSAPE